MKMLFLLIILGFSFVVANKSSDESIKQATLKLAERSKVLFNDFLNTPTNQNEALLKSRTDLTSSKFKKLKIIDPPPSDIKRVTGSKIKDRSEKVLITNNFSQATTKDRDMILKAGDVNSKEPSTAVFNPINRATPTKKIVTDMVANEKVPTLPEAIAVLKRPLPKKPETLVSENTTRILDLKRRERKLYDDASRILMSIK